jgi:hypothetical protein
MVLDPASCVERSHGTIVPDRSSASNVSSLLPDAATLKACEPRWIEGRFGEGPDRLVAGIAKSHIDALGKSLKLLEAEAQKAARQLPNSARLTSIPGVGRILGTAIALEAGPISRFAGPGHFASYCRTVPAKRLTNAEKKGLDARASQPTDWRPRPTAFPSTSNGARAFRGDPTGARTTKGSERAGPCRGATRSHIFTHTKWTRPGTDVFLGPPHACRRRGAPAGHLPPAAPHPDG